MEKLETNKNFIEGKTAVKERKLEPEKPQKYQWHRKIVSAKEWKDKYQEGGYCILNIRRDGAAAKEVEFAYISTKPVIDLVVSDESEINKIKQYLQTRNLMI